MGTGVTDTNDARAERTTPSSRPRRRRRRRRGRSHRGGGRTRRMPCACPARTARSARPRRARRAASVVSSGPSKKSAAAISRRPAGPTASTTPPVRTSDRGHLARGVGVGDRADGGAAVADRRVGDVAQGLAEQGQGGVGPVVALQPGVPDERADAHPASVVTSTASSPATPLMSTRWPGVARRMLSTGMRLCPPASTLPSWPTSPSTATASSTVRGAWCTNGPGFTCSILPVRGSWGKAPPRPGGRGPRAGRWWSVRGGGRGRGRARRRRRGTPPGRGRRRRRCHRRRGHPPRWPCRRHGRAARPGRWRGPGGSRRS